MTRQEEIREGIDDVIDRMVGHCLSHTERWTLRDLILKVENELGVVIEVGETRKYDWDIENYTCTRCGYIFDTGDYNVLDKMVKRHYHEEHNIHFLAVEPLIKEK